MAIIGEWIRRLGYLLRRRAREDELRREMEAHRALMEEPRAFGNTLAPAGRGAGRLGLEMARRLRAGHALCAADAPPQSRVRAHGGRDPCARHRRQHRHVQPRQRPAAAAAVPKAPTMWWQVRSRSTAPAGGGRAFSYPNYRDLQEGTTDIFANLAASTTEFVGLDVGDGPRQHDGVRRDRQLLPGLRYAAGAWTPFHHRRGTARRRDPRGDHQLSALGAARRRPGHARPARAHQRRAVHGRRRGAEGIRGDEHPRARSLAAPWRARDVPHGRWRGRPRRVRARRTS